MKELREEERREKRIERGQKRWKRREEKEDKKYRKAVELRMQQEGVEQKRARRGELERVEHARDPDGGGVAGWVWEDGGSGESWEEGQEEERPDEVVCRPRVLNVAHVFSAKKNQWLRGEVSHFLKRNIYPDFSGQMIQFDLRVFFQNGWFNHQLGGEDQCFG